MEKIIIPNRTRFELKKTLSKYGVDRFSLFPSLDGLAALKSLLTTPPDLPMAYVRAPQ